MSNTAVQEAFDRMDPDMTGEVGFEAFRRWRKLKMDMYRRELRNNVREVFDMVDEDGGGTLDIDECATMMGKIGKKFKGVDFDPPFHLADDFAVMEIVRGEGEVTWEEFLEWFMERTGDDEPDIPVLPEYMVRKVVGADTGLLLVRGALLPPPLVEADIAGEQDDAKVTLQPPAAAVAKPQQPQCRAGKDLWAFLRPRLGMMVKLQKQWGKRKQMFLPLHVRFQHKNIIFCQDRLGTNTRESAQNRPYIFLRLNQQLVRG
jgi:Ca2+-binding EF-hand superfamily protein